MESSEFSQEEEPQDQGTSETPTGAPPAGSDEGVEEIDEQPAGSEEEDVEPEGGGATDAEGTPETSGESS